MLGDIWSSSEFTAKNLGITEIKLSFLRENGILKPGILKPGIHWKSSPLGQKKPWKPKALYNKEMCRKIINKFYLEEDHNIAA